MRMQTALLSRLARAKRDAKGTSAIEFAIIAPMLIAAVIGLGDISTSAYGASNMQTAVRAGIHYAMSGGTDADLAQEIADDAWTRKPDGGVVTSAKSCKCATLDWDCETFCPDVTRPEMYITVTATATFTGNFYSMGEKTTTETVRVR
jgi:Flp pilus assembly protein TadG